MKNCFAKGGGKEHDVPDWYKRKQEARAKETKKESVNSAAKTSSKCKNHAYVAVSPTSVISVPQTEETLIALIITSGHDHEAFSMLPSTDLIVDCGASSHFSPDKPKFINFEAITPEPIHAADGHIFSAIGHGDLVMTLPIKGGETGPPITLK